MKQGQGKGRIWALFPLIFKAHISGWCSAVSEEQCWARISLPTMGRTRAAVGWRWGAQ